MPADLPHANDVERALAAREQGDGFDTQVAEFFDAIIDEEIVPTEIDEEVGEFAKAARRRVQKRATTVQPPIMR